MAAAPRQSSPGRRRSKGEGFENSRSVPDPGTADRAGLVGRAGGRQRPLQSRSRRPRGLAAVPAGGAVDRRCSRVATAPRRGRAGRRRQSARGGPQSVDQPGAPGAAGPAHCRECGQGGVQPRRSQADRHDSDGPDPQRGGASDHPGRAARRRPEHRGVSRWRVEKPASHHLRAGAHLALWRLLGRWRAQRSPGPGPS